MRSFKDHDFFFLFIIIIFKFCFTIHYDIVINCLKQMRLTKRSLFSSVCKGIESLGRWLNGGSLVAQTVKNLPAMQETQVRSLGGEVPLE